MLMDSEINDGSVSAFYSAKGWINVDGFSLDASLNENLTACADKYVKAVRERLGEHLNGGEKLLDIGCGPIQYLEYLNYSNEYQYRYCVDFSATALSQARTKLGDKGRYFQGDFLDAKLLNVYNFDAALLINVLYHVRIDMQEEFVLKLLSHLRPGGKAIIVYSNPRSISTKITNLGKSMKSFRKNSKQDSVSIYFQRHDLAFWDKFNESAVIKIYAWRTFSPQIEKVLFRNKKMLDVLFRLENLSWWWKISEYQTIVLEKK
jgi:SAM-dependent methyltransferase